MSEERILRAVGTKPRQIGDMPLKNGEAYSVHVSKILEEQDTQVSFLVPGCIPRGNIVLISGESGAKKSWLAYDLAGAVAAGRGWLGKDLVCPDGPQSVMILNYDNPTETLRTRLKKLGFTAEDQCFVHTLGHTRPYLPNAPELLLLPEQQSRLRYMLEYRKPALVIFDSFRQGVTLNEDDSKEMASIMGVFKSWMEINNTTVVLIHHTSKSEKSGAGWKAQARGSGEIIASSDVVIEVRADGEMEWTKSRTWDVGKTRKVSFDVVDKFEDGEVSTDETDESIQDIELVQRVLVRAMTPLPFEMEARAIDRVMKELDKSHNQPFVSFPEMKKRLGKEKDVFKNDAALLEALRNARLMGRAKFVRNKFGRGYRSHDAN